MRLYQNLDWNDAQRERLYHHQIDDLYDEMKRKWLYTGAETPRQKVADIVEGATPDDARDKLIIANILIRDETGDKYPVPILEPKDTDSYKQRNKALARATSIVRRIRRDATLGFLAPIAIMHAIKDNGDQRMTYVDAKTRTNAQLIIRNRWLQKQRHGAETAQTTAQIIETRSELPDNERKRLKNEEIRKRKQRQVQ